MLDMILKTDTPVPAGMIRLPSGLDLEDNGYSRLIQLYEEAYELMNDEIVVSIAGLDIFKLPLQAFEHTAAEPKITITPDIIVLPGGSIQTPREEGNGEVVWCGSHSIGDRETVRFNLDGLAATFTFHNPYADSYEK